MSAETIVKGLMTDVPKAVAAGVVDMGTGMLLHVSTVESHPQEVLDLVSAATKDLFEGDNVTTIENTFKKVRGVDGDERYFQEIIVTSTNLLHVFARLKSMPTVVAIVVCRVDANLGAVLMKTRSICSSDTV